jgi:uncharacterized protein
MIKVVIDTNVLLMSIPKISKYRPIFDGLIKSKYGLAISEDIFQEYVEITGRKTTGQIAQNLGELLTQLENVEKTEVYFKWNLITSDPDDNKFVDCAISANAQFIVSNDNHFKVLKDIEFPSVDVVDADEFLEELKKLK